MIVTAVPLKHTETDSDMGGTWDQAASAGGGSVSHKLTGSSLCTQHVYSLQPITVTDWQSISVNKVAGAATSIIFVTAKVLSRQTRVCCDKTCLLL